MDPQAQISCAFEKFDAANAMDPRLILVNGHETPYELAYAHRMTQWLAKIEPQPSVPLQLAARAQHLCRWKVPRSDYPMDRTGYLRWRTDLKKMHADLAAQILESCSCDSETIQQVRGLLLKQNLTSDPDMQTLENVICLVFLESYFDAFAEQHDDDKIINILRKTWAKMSAPGHSAALTLPMSERAQSLVSRALS